jgi:hypothetical protein
VRELPGLGEELLGLDEGTSRLGRGNFHA